MSDRRKLLHERFNLDDIYKWDSPSFSEHGDELIKAEEQLDIFKDCSEQETLFNDFLAELMDED